MYTREQFTTVVAAARRHGADVLCRSYSEQGCRDAVLARIRSLEHGVFVAEDRLHEMRRRGTYFTPTLTAIAGLVDSDDPVLAARGREFLPVLRQAVCAAHELGVPVAAGTDSAGGQIDPFGGEVALMHEAGLPALDAIRTPTTTAARLTGLSGSAGRPAQGFRGDAVLLDGRQSAGGPHRTEEAEHDDRQRRRRRQLTAACGTAGQSVAHWSRRG